MTFVQLIFDGLAMGLVFVILASGMAILLSVSKILFMAYGVFYTIGAYATWYIVNMLNWPYAPSLILGVVGAAVLGVLSYLLIFQYLQNRPGGFLATLIASLGLNLILTQGGVLIYGSQQRGLPNVFSGALHFWGVNLAVSKLVLIAASVIVTIGLFLIFEKTKLGRGMRAVAFLPRAASLQGVNTKKVYILAFAVATALAGVAGALLAPTYGMNPQMGVNVLWTVFLMTMLGGAGNLIGALVGGLVIGQVLSFGQYYIGSSVQIVVFVLIGIVLYFRPQGLMGSGVDIGLPAGGDGPGPGASMAVRRSNPRLNKVCFALGVVIFASIPIWTRSPYYLDLFIAMVVNALLAMTFVLLLRTGLINMGLIVFFGVGAYCCAVLTAKLGLSFWAGLPLSIVITGVIALGLGWILIGSGSGGFSFVMLSAVVGMLFPVLVGSIGYVGSYSGIANIPAPTGFTSPVHFFYLITALALVMIAVLYAFYRRWTGRAWTAIGLNPRLAQSVGVNLFRYRLLAFVLASIVCGVAGYFNASYRTYVDPNGYGMWLSIYVQLYAILGGLGFAILGPLVGAGIMTFLPEFLRFTSTTAPIITGGLLVLVILFLPRGLLSLGQGWRGRAVDFQDLAQMPRRAVAAVARVWGGGKR